MATKTARSSVEPKTSFEQILAKAGTRDRYNVEKHLANCDAEATNARGDLWRRLLTKLSTLAPLPLTTLGPNIVQFHRPDGKYRMQVFSIEDAGNGLVYVYLPDVIDAAVAGKLLKQVGEGYTIPGGGASPLPLMTIDSTNTADPAAHVKHLIGWKRKALRVALDASEPQGPRVDATESLCDLAAVAWTSPQK